jgi:copper chaperone CopZ
MGIQEIVEPARKDVRKVAADATTTVNLARHRLPPCRVARRASSGSENSVVRAAAIAYGYLTALLGGASMSHDVQNDQFVAIRITGMHCHRCQQTIRKALTANPGVHEVEVDFPSGLASVLFDPKQVTIRQLMDAVNESGYSATGFSHGQRGEPDAAHP